MKRPPRPKYDAARDGNPFEWIVRTSRLLRTEAIERQRREEIERWADMPRETLIPRKPVRR